MKSEVSLKERFIHINKISWKYEVSDYLFSALCDTSAVINNWAQQVIFVRERNINTLYDIANRNEIDREIVSISVNMIDRCLSNWIPQITKGASLPYELDVYCMTAFFIAIKTQVGNNVRSVPPIETFLPQYSKELLQNAEIDILYELNWHVMYPTPLSIVRDLLSLLPLHWEFDPNKDAFANYLMDVYLEVRNMAELATLSYSCSMFSSTTVALATVMSAIQSLNSVSLFQKDPVQLFREAVVTHLGELGISCDAKEVHDCYMRISTLTSCKYQKLRPSSVENDQNHVPVTP